MTTTQRLAEIVERLQSRFDRAAALKDARKLLSELDDLELARAEEELSRLGLDAGALEPLCGLHTQARAGQSARLRAELPTGHVLHTMLIEHDRILAFLDRLEMVNRVIQTRDTIGTDAPVLVDLLEIADHLLAAEPHHQREEQVLFVALERLGIEGPPAVMRAEHEELRRLKHELEELAIAADRTDFGTFKRELQLVSWNLISTLREHIQKENEVLYPMALRAIKSQETWSSMKVACDRIGYCCFTPEQE
jgi:DUF438 domain-containing protein